MAILFVTKSDFHRADADTQNVEAANANG